MRRNFWFFVVLMSSFMSLQAQEVDVMKLTADTKTFIFSDGKHTVKNYVYERLQAQTNCCGQDRIYLEIKVDPSGYVLQVKALTGKNDCFKESVIDIVKNIKWDASDFKAPKSIFCEFKPELGCDNGKENKYAKLPTFNNPKLDPNGIPTNFSSSTGVPSTVAQPTNTQPVAQPTQPAAQPVVTTTTPPATTSTPQPSTPTAQPTTPTPSTVVANTPTTTTVTPPAPTQPTTVTPPPARPQPIDITKTPEFQNAVADAVKKALYDSKMEEDRKRQEDIAKLRAALDKQIAEEEKARKEAAIAQAQKEAEEKKKADEEAAKLAAEEAKKGKGKGGVDFGMKEEAISPEELAARRAAEEKAAKDRLEAEEKLREAEKIAKMSPIERLDYEHTKRLQAEDKRVRDMETKLQNELAGLESKKREAEAQQRALEEARKKQELEAQRAADDILKKKNEVVREKDNADLAKIDAEKKLAEAKKGVYEQEAKKREEEMKRLQAELEKQQAEVQRQLEAIKTIEDRELAKKQEAALHAVAANGGAPIETPAPAPVAPSTSKVPLDTAAINTLMQQNDVLRKQLYYLQQQLEANKRGNTNISIQASPTVSGAQMNRPSNDGYKIDYQAPSKTEVALPDNKNANIQRDMGDQQEPKKAQPAKPATPAKGATTTPAKGAATPAKGAAKPTTEIVVPKKPVAAEGSKPEVATAQPEAINVPSSEAKATYVSTGDKTPEGTHLDTYKNTEIATSSAPEYIDGQAAMKTYLREKLLAAGVCGLVHIATELNVDKAGNVVSFKILKTVAPEVEQKLPSILLGMKFKTGANAPQNQPVYIEVIADARCAGKTSPVDVKKVENYIHR